MTTYATIQGQQIPAEPKASPGAVLAIVLIGYLIIALVFVVPSGSRQRTHCGSVYRNIAGHRP